MCNTSTTQQNPPCCPSKHTPHVNTHTAPFSSGKTVPYIKDFDPQLRAFTKIKISGGRALLGTKKPLIADDGESPLRRKTIDSFYIGETAVTNAQFAAFVTDTGYVTETEKFGWSFVFHSHVPTTLKHTPEVVGLPWWRRVDGANWYDVLGADSHDAHWHADHPVVHVTWNDARAFATWAGGRLPTEIEWEHAARGGSGDSPYYWGEAEPNDTDFFPCNIWQGQFPHLNLSKDGYDRTAPAKSFAPNGYGLYNVLGNVWEWTADDYHVASLKKSVKQRLKNMQGYKISKGGSFLCHASYCHRYRTAARSGTSPDTSTPHQGFRMVWDI